MLVFRPICCKVRTIYSLVFKDETQRNVQNKCIHVPKFIVAVKKKKSDL